MPKKPSEPRKNAGGKKRSSSVSKPKRTSVDKRLNDIFDVMIDDLLESLEHNYDRRKQEKP